MHSSLTKKIMLADPSNYTVGRQGYKVCKITPHHMACSWTAERCAQSFQNPTRNASANYCIGNDGTIVCNVDEVNRAWTSGNWANDCQAITIEVANCTGAPTWEVSPQAWDALVRLCADICKRYGFRLNFNNHPSGSLTMHRMFQSTSCPGPYLSERMPQLAREVNAILDGTKPSKPQPSKPDQVCSVGSVVRSRSMAISAPDGVSAIKTIEGDLCVYIPAIGGYFPMSLVHESADTKDGRSDDYLANTNARVYISDCVVEAVDAKNNLIKIHGIWVDPTPFDEIKEGR